jgi:hyperosmotically inducible protein
MDEAYSKLTKNWRQDMKSATWIAAPAIALLALASAPVSARATLAPQSVGEKTKDGAEKTKDAVVKGVTVAADKTKEGLSKTGEVMTDEWITGRVHARMVDEDLLKGSNISVDTSKHVVTLTGTVTAQAGRTRATSVTKGTEGVHRVINRLTIGPKV